MQLAGAVGGDDDNRRRRRLDGAELRDGDLEVREQFQQIAFELLIRPVELVDEQYRGPRASVAERLQQRPFDQEVGTEQLAGARAAIARGRAVRLGQADLDQLPRVVPLVHRVGDVEPLIALQADQVGPERRREHLRDLGLADAGLALQQQRSVQLQREVDRSRQTVVGDVQMVREQAPQLVDGGRCGCGHGRVIRLAPRLP